MIELNIEKEKEIELNSKQIPKELGRMLHKVRDKETWETVFRLSDL